MPKQHSWCWKSFFSCLLKSNHSEFLPVWTERISSSTLGVQFVYLQCLGFFHWSHHHSWLVPLDFYSMHQHSYVWGLACPIFWNWSPATYQSTYLSCHVHLILLLSIQVVCDLFVKWNGSYAGIAWNAWCPISARRIPLSWGETLFVPLLNSC